MHRFKEIILIIVIKDEFMILKKCSIGRHIKLVLIKVMMGALRIQEIIITKILKIVD